MITIPITEPPAVLYKYYPPERLDVIEGPARRNTAIGPGISSGFHRWSAVFADCGAAIWPTVSAAAFSPTAFSCTPSPPRLADSRAAWNGCSAAVDQPQPYATVTSSADPDLPPYSGHDKWHRLGSPDRVVS